MAPNPSLGPTGSGGFLRILGIIYLVRLIRQRRAERRAGTGGAAAED